MSEIVEKQLKDYKGFKVWKLTDNKGHKNKETIYMVNNQDGDNLNCFKAMKELKQWVDLMYQ